MCARCPPAVDALWTIGHNQGLKGGCEQLTALLAQLDGEVNLVGHSLGGHVALQYAALHPGRVDTLCVIGTRLREMGDVWQDGPHFL